MVFLGQQLAVPPLPQRRPELEALPRRGQDAGRGRKRAGLGPYREPGPSIARMPSLSERLNSST